MRKGEDEEEVIVLAASSPASASAASFPAAAAVRETTGSELAEATDAGTSAGNGRGSGRCRGWVGSGENVKGGRAPLQGRYRERVFY